jgi:hypothetical protein
MAISLLSLRTVYDLKALPSSSCLEEFHKLSDTPH